MLDAVRTMSVDKKREPTEMPTQKRATRILRRFQKSQDSTQTLLHFEKSRFLSTPF